MTFPRERERERKREREGEREKERNPLLLDALVFSQACLYRINLSLKSASSWLPEWGQPWEQSDLELGQWGERERKDQVLSKYGDEKKL